MECVCSYCGAIIDESVFEANDGLCDKCFMVKEMHTDEEVAE